MGEETKETKRVKFSDELQELADELRKVKDELEQAKLAYKEMEDSNLRVCLSLLKASHATNLDQSKVIVDLVKTLLAKVAH